MLMWICSITNYDTFQRFEFILNATYTSILLKFNVYEFKMFKSSFLKDIILSCISSYLKIHLLEHMFLKSMPPMMTPDPTENWRTKSQVKVRSSYLCFFFICFIFYLAILEKILLFFCFYKWHRSKWYPFSI